MRILGIDPGSRITGYGVVEKRGSSFLHVDNGCLILRPADPIPYRLEQIYSGLLEMLARYKPDAAAVEEVFFAKNAASSIKLGEARGVALLAAVQARIPVFEYATREVKQAITGFGQASKDQVQKMVKSVLGLPQVAQEDASDALAVAICHLQSYRLKAVVG
ncbi:MAG TPA: crossover junction endodeoxyribonuclease RuvC [bacterium]|nr:crossover junction endodeoxyribonuclease RuvC [bacterium]